MPDIPDNHIRTKKGSPSGTPASGGLFSRSVASKFIPFMIYLAVWGVIYIGNRHYAQQVELEVSELQEELQTYRSEYLTMKAELMLRTKQSEVAQMVDTLGLQELTTPPEKIRVEPPKSAQKPRD